MSLINEVLKDIDNKPEAQDPSMLGLMHSTGVKRKPSRRFSTLVWVVVLALCALAGSFVYQSLFSKTEFNVPFLSQPDESKPVISNSHSEGAVASAPSSVKMAAVKHKDSHKGSSSTLDESIDEKLEVPAEAAVEAEPQKTSLAVVANTKSQDSDVSVAKQPEPTVDSNTQPSQSLTSASNNSASISASKASQSVEKAVVETPTPIKPEKTVTPMKHVSANASHGQGQMLKVSNAPVASSDAKLPSAQTAQVENTAPASSNVSMVKTREVTLYEQALAALRAGQTTEAQSLVNQLLAINEDPRYLALNARLLLEKSPAALVAYIDQKGLDIGSTDELLALSASAYQRTGDHARAVKAYDLLVQRDPTEGRWWLAMAFSFEALESWDKSLKSYTLALQSGTLPANARQYAAIKATELNKKIEALAKQAEEQE